MAVTVQPQRVDIVLQPPVPPSGDAATFSDVDEAYRTGSLIASRISTKLDNVHRIGLVINYVKRTQTIEEANTVVLDDIGINRGTLKHGSDISFGTNKRMYIDDIEVNRIMRWQVEQFINIGIVLGSVGMPMQQSTPIYASSMSLDLNTVLHNKIITQLDTGHVVL